MESVANLVDIMLVFACGLMVAIIIYWNVDLNNIVNIIDQEHINIPVLIFKCLLGFVLDG